MNLPLKLAHYRTRQRLSQNDLAELLQVSRQSVSKWETGTALPSLDNIKALSRLYGVTVDHLLDDEAAPMPEEQLFPPPEEASSEGSAPKKRANGKTWLLVLLLAVVFVLMGMKLNRIVQDARSPHIPIDDLKKDENSTPDMYFEFDWSE